MSSRAEWNRSIERRRQRLAQAVAAGMSKAEIVAELGLSENMYKRDLDAIRYALPGLAKPPALASGHHNRDRIVTAARVIASHARNGRGVLALSQNFAAAQAANDAEWIEDARQALTEAHRVLTLALEAVS